VVEAGASIVAERRVDRVEASRECVRLHTAGGVVTARSAVVASGAWSRALLAPLGIDLPVVATRETVAYVEVERADELPAIVFAALPEAPDGSRGRDIATYALADDPTTLKIGVHHTGPEAHPDESGQPDPATAAWVFEFIGARLPGRAGRPLRTQTCLYTNSSDERFVLERHGRIVVGSACSGHGFKFAPVIGKTLASLALEAASS
jgi:sarcosine oxidase